MSLLSALCSKTFWEQHRSWSNVQNTRNIGKRVFNTPDCCNFGRQSVSVTKAFFKATVAGCPYGQATTPNTCVRQNSDVTGAQVQLASETPPGSSAWSICWQRFWTVDGYGMRAFLTCSGRGTPDTPETNPNHLQPTQLISDGIRCPSNRTCSSPTATAHAQWVTLHSLWSGHSAGITAACSDQEPCNMSGRGGSNIFHPSNVLNFIIPGGEILVSSSGLLWHASKNPREFCWWQQNENFAANVVFWTCVTPKAAG